MTVSGIQRDGAESCIINPAYRFILSCPHPVPSLSPISPSSHSEAGAPRRRLYSAVPGRHFVAVRLYAAQAEGEINLYKGDRVKGEMWDMSLGCCSLPGWGRKLVA